MGRKRIKVTDFHSILKKGYVPRTGEGIGSRIDWDALCKYQGYDSIPEMIDCMYADTDEKVIAGKLPLYTMARYLGIQVRTLRRLLLSHGYKIPKLKKRSPRIRIKKVFFPYFKLGFKTEIEMWLYFVKTATKIADIRKLFLKNSGKHFSYDQVRLRLWITKKNKT